MRADIHDGPEHTLQSEAGYNNARPHNQVDETSQAAVQVSEDGRPVYCQQQTFPHPRRPVARLRSNPPHIDNLPAASPSAFIGPCPLTPPAETETPDRKAG